MVTQELSGAQLEAALRRAGCTHESQLQQRHNWHALSAKLIDWHGADWPSKIAEPERMLWFKRAFVGAMLGDAVDP